jgi:hypothetical protein
MYQFCELDDFLKTQGKDDIRRTLSGEMKNLVDARKALRVLQTTKKEAA